MPGLSQLKQFTSDILNLGDEVKIRAARGEKPVTVPIPKDITIDDDSEDFRLGMPQLSEEEEQQAQALAEERNREANDFSDITGESDNPEASETPEVNLAMPDVSDLLAGPSSSSLDDLDLSEFEEPPEEEEEPEPEETPIEDLDLDSLLALSNPPADDDSEEDYDGYSSYDETPSAPSQKINPHKMDHEPSLDDMDFGSVSPAMEDAGGSASRTSDEFNDTGLPPIDMNDGLPEEFNEKPASPDVSESASASLDLPDFGETKAEETESSGADVLDGSETPDFGNESDDEPIPQFDTSAMDDMDFSEPGAVSTGDDDMFSGMETSDTDFEIPNFTEPAVEKQDGGSFNKKAAVSTPDFSQAEEDENNKPKNTFTDAEYKAFRNNLAKYPLNLRIAIENMVVSNEFTDDSIYAVLEKVLRKVPARQLASQLDKELDIHVEVPRDFERRTAEEYEVYKQSLEYKLKNRILPFAIITATAAILMFCIGFLSFHFIWKPLRAEHFYKQGYAQIQENLYPQSEESFELAVRNKAKKKWFYKYAESYSDHHQYERAENIYKAALALFDHDKKAGLDWAKMEQRELFAYAESERILKREVLDYHTNDPDAILQLGDLYLEWADEEDPAKYADAKEMYDMLVLSKAKENDLYLYHSREMRYYIHVDDLEKVLQYKMMFYPSNIKRLDSQDLTELSGYLLDKRYGELRPSEEHLRISISDVKDLLEQAVKKDQTNPTALYNMGRYSIVTSSYKNAESMLNASIDAFSAKSTRTKKETRTFINAYRLLGEQYKEQQEYILAQQTYNNGIDLFEKENRTGAFDGTKDIGILYADLGDINYFINGDMDAALDNFKKSVANKNDTAPVRYKIGYIDYINHDYDGAWDSFVNGNELSNGKDCHTLLALGNTLAINNDYFTAEGYYQELIENLDDIIGKYTTILPQGRSDHADLVDVYRKATNNLGVVLSRIANLNGESETNGKAFVNFQESSRAWDALTRDQETMERDPTNNLAYVNSTYAANPSYGQEPTIYTDIPKAMYGEEILKQK
ncbi:MAG: hypothetical protein IIU46_04410 [Treponema sp.]|nr:hypothetical protein [Treponema sp.]